MKHYVLDARTATPHFPGIGRYASNVARALIPQLADDERLTVLAAPEPVLELPPHPRVAVRVTPISPFSLRQQWAIPRLLRQLEADLYHSAYYLMPYAPGKPTLLTVYDLIPLLFPERASWRARLLFRAATGLALRAAQRYIAISQASRQDFLTHFQLDPAHITAAPLAADPVFRPQDAAAIAEFRRQHALPEQYVLYLGSNKPHKNLERLIEAWGQIEGELPEYTLVVAGAWLPQHPEPRQRAEALKLEARVRWLGPAQGKYLPALYSAATVFVFPSLYEGFGLPPLEALACGAPVACSATSSMPEVLGDAAIFFNPTEVDAIAAALRRLLQDAALRQDLRQRALERAAQFTWEATARQTLAVYRQMLQEVRA